MKKILIGLLIVLLISLGLTVVLNGMHIGSFVALGFKGLGRKNQELENKITEATTLTSVTFPEKLSSLNSASKTLVSTKEKYQDKVAYSSEENVRRANEEETYQVDFLFTRLGNHAKKFGLVIDLDAKRTSATGVYNINFTLHGKYTLIADFVRAVENDSELKFTIQNFILTPDTDTQTLKAEFVVPDLRLDVDENIANSTVVVPMGNDANSTKQSNTTNTTNTSTSSTRNTTSKANTTNTSNTST